MSCGQFWVVKLVHINFYSHICQLKGTTLLNDDYSKLDNRNNRVVTTV